MSPRTRSFKQNCLLDNAVASNVAEFLDVKSLVRFFSCSKKMKANDTVLQAEVARRKAVFAQKKTCVKKILKEERPSRESIVRAQEIFLSALELIALCEGGAKCIDIGRMFNGPIRRDPFFGIERALLSGPFRVLPTCFYCPPSNRGWLLPSENDLVFARNHAHFLWDAVQEPLLNFLDSVPYEDTHYSDPKFPFRLFQHPVFADFRDQSMMPLTTYVKRDAGRVDAFRIAARDLATDFPDARHFLHFILHHADHFDDEDESDGIMSGEEDTSDDDNDAEMSGGEGDVVRV